MGSPLGGDGGYTLVDQRPGQACNLAGEYVFLTIQVTNNCGNATLDTPSVRVVAPFDPGPRFIAPFSADSTDPDRWIAAGQYVWTQSQGYRIQSGADWTRAFDLGAGHSATAVAMRGGVGYVAWCGPCNNRGFTRGLATNAGGTWHQLDVSALPNRYLADVAIDPRDATGNTALAVVNGFSRRWTEGPGAGVGHVYRTSDGGVSWADVSGNLPDVPANSLLVTARGALVLGTDLGAVTSTDGGAHWQRIGANLPTSTVMQVLVGPDGQLYAATHGRGIWRTAA